MSASGSHGGRGEQLAAGGGGDRHDAGVLAIELERAAGRAYWAWVSAGLRLEVQRGLLTLAQDRDEALRKQIVAGGVPAVEGIDNRRAIVDRGARIVAAERALQQAAFDLARHLRDADGEVQAPAPLGEYHRAMVDLRAAAGRLGPEG